MRSVFLNYLSTFSLHWWPWLKIGFYCSYFLFFQISNYAESSVVRFLVNILIFLSAIGIIELCQYMLHLLFRRRHYTKALMVLGSSYIVLAILGYYIIHVKENIVSDVLWNRQFEASWSAFLKSFSRFYWTFFKYALILFLLKQVLLLIRLRGAKNRGANPLFITMEPILTDAVRPQGATISMGFESPKDFPDHADKLPVKVGSITHMLDISNIVYLEVQDEITTIYQVDGSPLQVKIPLSRFCERLPKDRFVRIHESWAVALPYIARESGGKIYMRFYEDHPLKISTSDRYPAYKKWKEHNRLK